MAPFVIVTGLILEYWWVILIIVTIGVLIKIGNQTPPVAKPVKPARPARPAKPTKIINDKNFESCKCSYEYYKKYIK
jgi:hypothetical protein